ncbi:MAG: hypothetical protein COU44_03525 [Candidatus Nealsonbacteria bacterium CG10_big_fil_rev_8_21_14_0_10_40_24]|nr:MAG: hypothetical protein COU44_03525 [Candidatus Nealsonbacteria bacterium CG10_big_fil_rev_8_21_14_0_10_40_24]
MKILILISQTKNTGSFLRAKYLAEVLGKFCPVEIFYSPGKSLSIFTLGLSLMRNLWFVLSKDYQVVIGFKPYPNIGIPILMAKIRGAKIVIDIDDLDWGYRKGILRLLVKFSQKIFPKRCHLVTYHHPQLKKILTQEFKVANDKIYQLEQGVNLNIFSNKSKRQEDGQLRRKYSLKTGKILFWMGHLNIAAELEDIFQIFEIILKKDKSFILIIAGGGPKEKFYKNLARELKMDSNVIFTDYQDPKTISQYLRLADLCLLYYREDKEVNLYRCSMKLREYLAAGKKVVTNWVESTDFRNFVYCSSSSPADFAQKILEIISNGDERHKLGQRFIGQNYDWQKIGQKFYQKLINLTS